MVEHFNNLLCIEARWLIDEGIMTESNYKFFSHKRQINVVRRACLNTPALVAYDSIPERFKKLIRAKIGDPYKAATKSALRNLLAPDENARKYYREYIIDSGEHLPESAQQEYQANAEILNAIHLIVTDRPSRARAIGKSRGLWPAIAKAVSKLDKTVLPHTLPLNHRRIQDRYNRYKATDNSRYDRIGYESIIHGNWCNKNSEKINDEAKVWLLSRWSSMIERVATTNQLHDEYNRLAVSQDWKPLKSADTIHNFLHQPDIQPLWWAARYGEQKSKEKFTYQHKTAMPTMRDSLWYSDGTKLNYFYQTRDENGRFQIKTTSVYEVMDVYSEALLGYHISDTEDYITQYSAYRMAIQTSQHKPYQITYDNQGGHKKLETGDFLTKLSHLSIKTKPYNGKSKTIESAFGRFQMQFLKKDWFFTGQNIQAKREESKANMEFIMANKHNLPTLEEVHETYIKRRNEWQNAPHPKTGVPRMEMYRQSSNPKAVKVELMDMVDLFWMLREKPVTCNAYGISFQEKGERYHYEVVLPNGMPDIKWLARNIDKKFRIKYDPQDFSMIYLYEETPQGLRFITEAHDKVTIHRGKQEQEEGEMERWSAIDKATAELREEMRETLMEMQRQHNQLPEQHGLVTPGIKGLKKDKTKKVKQPADNFGRLQKAMSNVVMANDENYEEDNLYDLM
jgi:hypothetical protein